MINVRGLLAPNRGAQSQIHVLALFCLQAEKARCGQRRDQDPACANWAEIPTEETPLGWGPRKPVGRFLAAFFWGGGLETLLPFLSPPGAPLEQGGNRTGGPSSSGRCARMPNTGLHPKRLVSPPFSVPSSPPTHTLTPWKLWMQLTTENKTVFRMHRRLPCFPDPNLARWL